MAAAEGALRTAGKRPNSPIAIDRSNRSVVNPNEPAMPQQPVPNVVSRSPASRSSRRDVLATPQSAFW